MDCHVLKCSNEATVPTSLRQSTVEEDLYGLPYEAALCESHAELINSGAEYLWEPGEQIVMGDDLTGLHEYVVLDVLDSTESIRLVSNPEEDGKRLRVKVRRRVEADADELTLVLPHQVRQKLFWYIQSS